MTPAAFAWTIVFVKGHVELALDQGDGSGLLSLLRRLEGLVEPASPLKGKRAEIGSEYGVWVKSMIEDLLPATVADACGEFRASRGFRSEIDDPWVAVDPDYAAQDARVVTKKRIKAQQAAISACRLYEQTHKTSHLREAVSALEVPMLFERTRRVLPPTVEACLAEKDRLRQALERALPDTAFPFYVEIVRARIDDGGSKVRTDHWLSDWGWTRQRRLRLVDVGDRFEPGIQAVYDAKLEEGKRAEEQRRADAVFEDEQRRAEEDRRYERARRESATSAALTEKEEKRDEDEATLLDTKIRVAVPKPKGFLAKEYVYVDLKTGEQRDSPSGSVSERMHPAMAAAVREELKHRGRWDAARSQRDADRVEYEHQLATRR
jgi:hypothetical protein